MFGALLYAQRVQKNRPNQYKTTSPAPPPLLPLTLIGVITDSSLLHGMSNVFFSVFNEQKKSLFVPKYGVERTYTIFFLLSYNPCCTKPFDEMSSRTSLVDYSCTHQIFLIVIAPYIYICIRICTVGKNRQK